MCEICENEICDCDENVIELKTINSTHRTYLTIVLPPQIKIPRITEKNDEHIKITHRVK